LLDALGVKFMVDLRHADERERAPNKWAPARVLTQADGGEHVAAVEVGARDAAARGRMKMIEAYAYIPYGRRFTALFGEFFRTLADEGGPVIIHCAIGKDRTGILSALLLSALGVDRETVFADFLATNDLLNNDERRRFLRDEDGVDTAQPRPGVTEDYLRATFDTIANKSGTLDTYFDERLAVTPAHVARLKERFLI
jgi:protein-tyrosine phosphatase